MLSLVVNLIYCDLPHANAVSEECEDVDTHNIYINKNLPHDRMREEIESLVTEKDNGNKLEIILPVYGYNNGDTAISSSTKRFTYDFINHTITMEIIETTFYDGRSGRVIFHSFIKKPKRVELQPNTYGYLEAMGALGNAQRTGKYTPKTQN